MLHFPTKLNGNLMKFNESMKCVRKVLHFPKLWQKNVIIALLFSKITKLEQDIDSKEIFDEYNKTEKEREKIYDNIAEGVKICSKCSWYQYGEKSTNCFYGLEKKNVLRETIKTLDDGKEITTPFEISLTLKKNL